MYAVRKTFIILFNCVILVFVATSTYRLPSGYAYPPAPWSDWPQLDPGVWCVTYDCFSARTFVGGGLSTALPDYTRTLSTSNSASQYAFGMPTQFLAAQALALASFPVYPVGTGSTFTWLTPAFGQSAITGIASYGLGTTSVGWPGYYGGGLGGSYWSWRLPTTSSYGGTLGGMTSAPFGAWAAPVSPFPTYDWANRP